MAHGNASGFHWVVAGAIALSGCANLASYKDGDPATLDETHHLKVGLVSYSLPLTRLVVTSTYVLKKCAAPTGSDDDISISTSAQIATDTRPDPDNKFYLDSNAFRGLALVKTSDLKIDRSATGLLQGINATISDRSGAILGASLSAALLATTAVGMTPSLGIRATEGAKPPKPSAPCKQTFVDALTQLAAAQAELETLNNPQNGDVGEKKPAATQAGGPGQTADPSAAEQKKAGLQAQIAALTAKLTITSVTRIIPTRDLMADKETATISIGPSPVSAWFKPETWGAVATALGTPRIPAAPLPTDLKVAIHAHIAAPGSAAPSASSDPLTTGSMEIDGVVYRTPVPADLRVCFGDCPPVDTLNISPHSGRATIEKNLVTVAAETTDVPIAQFGDTLVAPLHSPLLQDRTLVMAQNADGTLTSIEFKSTSTADTVLSGIGQVFSGIIGTNNQTTTANSAALCSSHT